MTRAAPPLVAVACAFALACGHEASAPSALRDVPEAPLVSQAPGAPTPVAGTPSRGSCIDVEDAAGQPHVTLEGRVFVDGLHEHPTRGKTHPFILRLDEPRCALGTDVTSVTEVHLTSIDGVPLKTLAGKHVRVSGDPFGAHTAWHARPVVLMTTKVTALP